MNCGLNRERYEWENVTKDAILWISQETSRAALHFSSLEFSQIDFGIKPIPQPGWIQLDSSC